jgi:hypothetical protein
VDILRKMKKLISIILAIALLLMIAVGLFNKPKENSGSPGNGSASGPSVVHPTGPANLTIREAVSQVQRAGNDWIKRQLGHVEVDVPDPDKFIPVPLGKTIMELPSDGSWTPWLTVNGCNFNVLDPFSGIEYALLNRKGEIKVYRVTDNGTFHYNLGILQKVTSLPKSIAIKG